MGLERRLAILAAPAAPARSSAADAASTPRLKAMGR